MEYRRILRETRLNYAGASLLYPLGCARNHKHVLAKTLGAFQWETLERLLDLALVGEVGVICHQGPTHQPKEQLLK